MEKELSTAQMFGVMAIFAWAFFAWKAIVSMDGLGAIWGFFAGLTYILAGRHYCKDKGLNLLYGWDDMLLHNLTFRIPIILSLLFGPSIRWAQIKFLPKSFASESHVLVSTYIFSYILGFIILVFIWRDSVSSARKDKDSSRDPGQAA